MLVKETRTTERTAAWMSLVVPVMMIEVTVGVEVRRRASFGVYAVVSERGVVGLGIQLKLCCWSPWKVGSLNRQVEASNKVGHRQDRE